MVPFLPELVAETKDSLEGVFFVHHCRKPDLAGRRQSLFHDPGEGLHHARQAGFGVAGAPAVETTVSDHRFEGGNGHAGHRDRVEMGFQNEPPGGVLPW